MQFQKKLSRIGLIAIPALLATAVTLAGEDQGQTVFRAATNYVSTDVIVKDGDGQFIPDLGIDDFKVWEDGELQTVQRFVRSIGGRSYTVDTTTTTSTPTLVPSEGLILPRSRPTVDTSGRIFLILIDDLHMQVSDTPRIKRALMDIRDTLIHENDLVGFVSTGPSGIEISPNYDFGHRRFDEAIAKTMGAGLKINDIIRFANSEGNQGPPGLRYAAHTAFKTAHGMLLQLAKITDRRKSFIYVSNGYSFDPFRDSRYARIKQHYQEVSDTPEAEDLVDEAGRDINKPINSSYDTVSPLTDQWYMQRTEFFESDLISEIAQLTREARRANVVFYALDPRGLTASIDLSVRAMMVRAEEWSTYIMTQGNSLRALSEETGGFAIIQTNDYTKGLQRIDAETSDYYIIGYTSTNPDPLKIQRTVKIEVERPDVEELNYRDSYTIPRPSRN